jgi:hypothetical protein
MLKIFKWYLRQSSGKQYTRLLSYSHWMQQLLQSDGFPLHRPRFSKRAIFAEIMKWHWGKFFSKYSVSPATQFTNVVYLSVTSHEMWNWAHQRVVLALRPNAVYGLLIHDDSNHTRRLPTVCRTSLCEWSARPRDLHLTTHKTHKRQTSMPPTEFEPTTSAGKQPQTYALDRVATGTGNHKHINVKNCPLALIYFYYIYSDYMPRLWQSSADKSHEICKLHWCGILYFGIPRLQHMCKNKTSWRTKA